MRHVKGREIAILSMIASCILFYIALHRYAPFGILSARRWDKLYQAAFLVPAVFGIAYLLALRIHSPLRIRFNCIVNSRFPLMITIVGFLSLAFTAYVILDHMPRSKDEAQYLFQGQLLVSGNLWAPAPPCPDAFNIRGIMIRGDRWIPAYDPGHSLLVGIGDLIGAGWLVGPIMGVLFLWFLWLLGEELYARRIAAIALVLALVSPFFILLAASFSYHVTSLSLTTLVLLGTAKRDSGDQWAFLTGLGLGGLVLVRPLALVFLAPSLIYLEIDYIRSIRRIPVSRWWRLTVVLLPLVLLYFLYNYSVTGHPLVTGRQYLYPQTLFGFGKQAAHAESYGSMGHSPLKGLLNVLIQVSTLSTGLFGWPLVSIAPAIIGVWLWKNTVWERAFILVLLTTAAVLFFSWYSAIEHGPRHYLDGLPGVLLLSAGGLTAAYRLLKRWRSLNPDVFMIILLTGLFAITLFFYLPVRIRDVRGPWLGVDPVFRRVFDMDIHKPALLFMEFPNAPADYYASGFIFNDPFLKRPILFARHRGLKEDLQCLEHFPDRSGYTLFYDPGKREIHVSGIIGQ